MKTAAPPMPTTPKVNLKDTAADALRNYLVVPGDDPSIGMFAPKLADRVANKELSPLELAGEFHRAVEDCARMPGFNARAVYRISTEILGRFLMASEVQSVAVYLNR